VLVDGGFGVDIASPLGGKAPYDPKSLGSSGERPRSVDRFLRDASAVAKAENAIALDAIDPLRYDAAFLVGGHGTMWDLPTSKPLAKLLWELVGRDRVIAAVCHGPAGLVSALGPDGQSIVRGKRLTAFTNAEEDAVRLTGVVPFSLESRLRELGADFEGGSLWESHAVRDGTLVTGQNPASSHRVAELVVEALT
jgi:putative intracellular protease/amidase